MSSTSWPLYLPVVDEADERDDLVEEDRDKTLRGVDDGVPLVVEE